jgi:hypothetical protein
MNAIETNGRPKDVSHRFLKLMQEQRRAKQAATDTVQLMRSFKADEADFVDRARAIANDPSMSETVRSLFYALVAMFHEAKAVVFDVSQPLEMRRYIVAALQPAIADAKVALKERLQQSPSTINLEGR